MLRNFFIKISIFFGLILMQAPFLFFVANADGLVPCSGLDCDWCSLMQLGKNIIDFMMYLIFPLATIAIVWGGILIMTSRESVDQLKRGRSIIFSAVIGILIALLSWTIIDTIIKVVALNFEASSFGPWNRIICSP